MATHYLKYGSKEVVSGPQTLSPFLFSYLTFVGGKGMGIFRRAIKLQITETSPRACISRKAVCGPETSKEASISYLNPSANFCTLHIDPFCVIIGAGCTCVIIGAGRVYYQERAQLVILYRVFCTAVLSLPHSAGQLWLHFVLICQPPPHVPPEMPTSVNSTHPSIVYSAHCER